MTNERKRYKMLSETLEQERKYQEDIRDAYNAGYNKGQREARPKIAHWIHKQLLDDDELWDYYLCSNCGLKISSAIIGFKENYNFCPKCGSNMKVEKK